MAPKRGASSSRAKAKRPVEAYESEAGTKARYGTSNFVSIDDYKRYKDNFSTRKVIPSRNINFAEVSFFKLHDLFGRMGWISAVSINEPVYSNLVRIFYSNLKRRYGGPIASGVRGVQIELTPDEICRIFDVPTVGLELYESKTWPTVPGFDPALAVQRLCGLSEATQSGRPNV